MCRRAHAPVINTSSSSHHGHHSSSLIVTHEVDACPVDTESRNDRLFQYSSLTASKAMGSSDSRMIANSDSRRKMAFKLFHTKFGLEYRKAEGRLSSIGLRQSTESQSSSILIIIPMSFRICCRHDHSPERGVSKRALLAPVLAIVADFVKMQDHSFLHLVQILKPSETST
jgi:hypothetical protein